jgi:DNA mismatch repair protein MutS2
MLYPQNIENKLGFDKIRDLLKSECVSSLGIGFVDKIRWSDDQQTIEKMLAQTEEFRQILLGTYTFPSMNFFDMNSQLNKAAIIGSFLTEEDFHRLKISLQTIVQSVSFFLDKSVIFPELSKLGSHIQIDKNIVTTITSKIDDNGVLKNNASQNLMEIRKQLQSKQMRLRKVLEKILRQAKNQGFTADDASFTVREGRMVIPLKAEHKRHIKGFVHDESASGQTVFLEPAEALEINNALRELKSKESREIIKILTLLTDFIRPYLQDLKKGYIYLGLIDFIRAKAKLALKIEASKPILIKGPGFDIINAKHPLLFLAHKAQGKPIVPLSIKVDQHNRILLISGPNAGGKSVTLKTVGLLQYMWQCGLLIPVADQSRIGLFKGIFIDIGDEQSIENDLSTYSSHLTNMKSFLFHANSQSLCLIDEFGTGTEPSFGGAIAQAILEALNNNKAFGVITTHYANLKEFAEQTPGIINGAMRFDLQKLEPLYQLIIGKPGSSFALEISKKIGLPNSVIEKSKENVGVEQVNMDHLLGELESERQKLTNKIRENQIKETLLKKQIEEYSQLKGYLDTNKKKLLKDARAEAKKLINDANQQIENTIREIKEQKADKEATRQSRAALEGMKNQLSKLDENEHLEFHEEEAAPSEEYLPLPGPIEVGDFVRLKDQGAIGEVLAIQGKDASVAMGSLKSLVKLKRLTRISRKEKRKLEAESSARPMMQGINLIDKRSSFSTNLDVRGMRGEESLSVIEAFIDDATMLGSSEVRIIHGKGDGILRKLTREKLKQISSVRSFQDEHVERGGAGVTVVQLK